ncbi:hypothetical protein [Sinobaca sp. H24]|uniref:hypothetical protein n=1 Tax=Sinobaca sp. H24 TaxID=2923376 RepID=UPI00207AC46D|nr:hypothetical protein [Sinobaca sp. H24]
MDQALWEAFERLEHEDKQIRYQAFLDVMAAAEEENTWSYDVWDRCTQDLVHRDPHRRATAAQILCRLAKSDPEERIFAVFSDLYDVTRDPKFVTARHALQSFWRIGLGGTRQKEAVVEALEYRFRECISEKNDTLIRSDILEGLKMLFDETGDAAIKEKALELMDIEDREKYQKKYMNIWK